jgi:hypothetical protein
MPKKAPSKRNTLPSALIFAVVVLATLTCCQGQEVNFEVFEESPPALLGNIGVKANLTSVLGQSELNSLQYTVVEDSGGVDRIFVVDQMSGELHKTFLSSFWI